METKGMIIVLPTFMHQLHRYYMADAKSSVRGFEVIVPA